MNPTKNDMNGKYVTLRDLDRRVAEMNLIKGASATIFSTCMFTFLAMLIIMTPDPKGSINYPLVVSLLVTFGGIFLYGVLKLDSVEKFLKGYRHG
jgi:hypothetical protein